MCSARVRGVPLAGEALGVGDASGTPDSWSAGSSGDSATGGVNLTTSRERDTAVLSLKKLEAHRQNQKEPHPGKDGESDVALAPTRAAGERKPQQHGPDHRRQKDQSRRVIALTEPCEGNTQQPGDSECPSLHRSAYAPSMALLTGRRVSCGSVSSRRCDVGPHPTAGVQGVQSSPSTSHSPIGHPEIPGRARQDRAPGGVARVPDIGQGGLGRVFC
jgi:hypothetical protein